MDTSAARFNAKICSIFAQNRCGVMRVCGRNPIRSDMTRTSLAWRWRWILRSAAAPSGHLARRAWVRPPIPAPMTAARLPSLCERSGLCSVNDSPCSISSAIFHSSGCSRAHSIVCAPCDLGRSRRPFVKIPAISLAVRRLAAERRHWRRRTLNPLAERREGRCQHVHGSRGLAGTRWASDLHKSPSYARYLD
jgi:hypothetical protein